MFQAESAMKVRGLSRGKVPPNDGSVGGDDGGGSVEGADATDWQTAASNNFGGAISKLWCKGGKVSVVDKTTVYSISVR